MQIKGKGDILSILKGKRGMMTSWEDFFKGLLFGIITGAVLLYLIIKGIIPLPFGIGL